MQNISFQILKINSVPTNQIEKTLQMFIETQLRIVFFW